MCTQDDRALLQGITVLCITTQTRTEKKKPSPFSKFQPNGESLYRQDFKAMMNEMHSVICINNIVVLLQINITHAFLFIENCMS